ncbi:MAG: polyribonucleotide nucleotidyltransferase [Anaerolineae bacterium]|nr:polyribonucleotide nucleotidyltransferase [Anaerolineae bacterium]
MESHTFETRIGDHEIVIETGKLAQLAGGAVTVRSGGSMVLATATASKEPREGIDFFPLTVDYEERLYAAGKIPGSFFRREGRPTQEAILTARLIDRPIRPLFPKGFRNDVQVVVTALSTDAENLLDILGIIGASAALTISDVPFLGPIGGVRVGYIDGEFVFNPTASELERSQLDLRLAGTREAILMVEAGANEVPEDVMLGAMRRGHEVMQCLIDLQEEMREKVGKPKRSFTLHEIPEATKQRVLEQLGDRLTQILEEPRSKEERNQALDDLLAALTEELAEEVDAADVKEVFEERLKTEVRERILGQGVRPDGRGPDDIRPIYCEVGLLPRAHGSGLFTRGETQVLTVATLGTPREEQILDDLGIAETKRYIHHYNFPPYSTGEVWPMRGPRRREIGHGALAERALLPVIPRQEEFPYTLRLVSEVLASNGSTSQASVCGSTLALMDAGVPIKAMVAGIAMGLVTDGQRHQVLTDIIGMEDHLGDMDFKVAGTREGITALQMDMKVQGIGYDILSEALERARRARLFILDRMAETIPEPRKELSPYAPRITIIKIDPEKIGAIIGPGGKTIRKMQEDFDVRIDVEEDGSVYVASVNPQGAELAIQTIQGLTEEAEIGKIYTGKVVRITDFGAFVEILPGQDGLVHISQLADYHANRVEDVVRVGDEIMVMVIDIDNEGKIRLSRRAVLEGWTAAEAREHDRRPARSSSGGGRGGRSGGRNRRR